MSRRLRPHLPLILPWPPMGGTNADPKEDEGDETADTISPGDNVIHAKSEAEVEDGFLAASAQALK